MMRSREIGDFLRLLKKSPSGAVFNPWWEVDEQNDVGRNAPAIRRNQLRAYLQKRVGKANVAVIGEAVGYRGGHFSGIPMTSERLLLGRSKRFHIKPRDFFSDVKPQRTSKPEKSERATGLTVLKVFLELFPCEQVVALGKIAAAQLEELNVDAHCVRHPASGGAKLFRQQIAEVVNKVA